MLMEYSILSVYGMYKKQYKTVVGGNTAYKTYSNKFNDTHVCSCFLRITVPVACYGVR